MSIRLCYYDLQKYIKISRRPVVIYINIPPLDNIHSHQSSDVPQMWTYQWVKLAVVVSAHFG